MEQWSRDIVNLYKQIEEQKEFREAKADTRGVAGLGAHLRLTAGLATVLLEELQLRGRLVLEGVERNLSINEVRECVRIAGLLHDLGKMKEGREEPRYHIQRSVEYFEEFVKKVGMPDAVRMVIRNCVERHHERHNPRTHAEKVVCLADSYASALDRPDVRIHKERNEPMRLEKELYGVEPPVKLVLVDVDAVKDWVFDTNKLPVIRAASWMLQRVEKEELPALLEEWGISPEAIIFAGGANALLVVPASLDNSKIESDLKHRYGKATLWQVGVTVAISEPLWAYDMAAVLPDLTADGVAGCVAKTWRTARVKLKQVDGEQHRRLFGVRVRFLQEKMRFLKAMRESAGHEEVHPVVQMCQYCCRRPAADEDEIRGERFWVCEACKQRADRSRKVHKKANMSGSSVQERLLAHLQKEKKTLSWADDLDDLSGDGGYIALIYADGNDMGRLFNMLPTPESYSEFSELLSRAVEKSVLEALESVVDEKSDNVPAEVIVAGGDDVLIICRAKDALSLAVRIVNAFEKQMDGSRINELLKAVFEDQSMPKVTMSCGVAIVDVKYPIRLAFDLAESLLKEAKKFYRAYGDGTKGTLNWFWLKAPVAVTDAETLFKQAYKVDGAGDKVSVTARPYFVDELERLLDVVKKFKKVARSRRKAIQQVLFDSIWASYAYVGYQAARARGDEQKTLKETLRFGFWRDLLPHHPIAGVQSVEYGFWWQEKRFGETAWRTALADVLELVELA